MVDKNPFRGPVAFDFLETLLRNQDDVYSSLETKKKIGFQPIKLFDFDVVQNDELKFRGTCDTLWFNNSSERES